MERIGAHEATTRLLELLERVAKGEKFTITKHGVPVATLQPAAVAKKTPVRKIINRIKRFRSQHRLGRLSVLDMIGAGRR